MARCGSSWENSRGLAIRRVKSPSTAGKRRRRRPKSSLTPTGDASRIEVSAPEYFPNHAIRNTDEPSSAAEAAIPLRPAARLKSCPSQKATYTLGWARGLTDQTFRNSANYSAGRSTIIGCGFLGSALGAADTADIGATTGTPFTAARDS